MGAAGTLCIDGGNAGEVVFGRRQIGLFANALDEIFKGLAGVGAEGIVDALGVDGVAQIASAELGEDALRLRIVGVTDEPGEAEFSGLAVGAAGNDGAASAHLLGDLPAIGQADGCRTVLKSDLMQRGRGCGRS